MPVPAPRSRSAPCPPATGLGTSYGTLTINGGEGDDLLTGGAKNDALHGVAGEDRLVGFKGVDRLEGGEGNDVLAWNNGDNSDHDEGGDGTDEVEVNGAPTAGDEFTAKPSANEPGGHRECGADAGQGTGRRATRRDPAGEHTLVTWTQQGHTCTIVASSAVPEARLVDLAASRNT
jgi:Ca2+-binding RTX toxin-like protein